VVVEGLKLGQKWLACLDTGSNTRTEFKGP
jgi:hypothetical protein